MWESANLVCKQTYIQLVAPAHYTWMISSTSAIFLA